MSFPNITTLPMNTTIANVTSKPCVLPKSYGEGFVNGDYFLNSALAYLLLQLLIITSASRALGWLFVRIKEPMVIAEMIVGITLGPSVLGRIPGWSAHIFPCFSIPMLSIVSNLGLVLFMFVVGLELDINLLKAKARVSIITSFIGVLFPFLIALPLAFILNKNEFINDTNVWVFFCFLAVVIGISALPVLARIIAEYRLFSTPLGVFTMNSTTVDDIMAWPILALSIALAGSTKKISIVWILLLAAGNVAFAFLVLRPVVNFICRRAIRARSETLGHTYFFMILFLMFLNAFLTEIIGLTSLIGALEVGLLIPRRGTIVSQLSGKIEDLIVVIFLPLFFTVSGLRTQIGLIDSLQLWGITALIILLTCVAKIVGCTLPARWIAKLSWRDSLSFGVLMNTKGLVALIAVNLGVSAGIITTRLFSMLVLMVIVNTVLTCPLLHLVRTIGVKEQPTEPQASIRKAEQPVVMILGTRESAVSGLITLASSVTTRSKVILLRLLESADSPSVYMGNISRKAVRRDPVVKAAMSRAVERTIDLEVICEVSTHVLTDASKMVGKQKANLLLLDCVSPQDLFEEPLQPFLQTAPCTVGIFLRPFKKRLSGAVSSRPLTRKASMVVLHSGGSVKTLPNISINTEQIDPSISQEYLEMHDPSSHKLTSLESLDTDLTIPALKRVFVVLVGLSSDEAALELASTMSSEHRIEVTVWQIVEPGVTSMDYDRHNRLLARCLLGSNIQIRVISVSANERGEKVRRELAEGMYSLLMTGFTLDLEWLALDSASPSSAADAIDEQSGRGEVIVPTASVANAHLVPILLVHSPHVRLVEAV